MSALDDSDGSDGPSLPSEFDDTLIGHDRYIKMVKDEIQMIRVLQHKVAKWKRKQHTLQQQHDEVEYELLLLQEQFTCRIATEEEWTRLDRLGDDQYELLSYIHNARSAIDDALEQIEECMQSAWHYIHVLESLDDTT